MQQEVARASGGKKQNPVERFFPPTKLFHYKTGTLVTEFLSTNGSNEKVC